MAPGIPFVSLTLLNTLNPSFASSKFPHSHKNGQHTGAHLPPLPFPLPPPVLSVSQGHVPPSPAAIVPATCFQLLGDSAGESSSLNGSSSLDLAGMVVVMCFLSLFTSCLCAGCVGVALSRSVHHFTYPCLVFLGRSHHSHTCSLLPASRPPPLLPSLFLAFLSRPSPLPLSAHPPANLSLCTHLCHPPCHCCCCVPQAAAVARAAEAGRAGAGTVEKVEYLSPPLCPCWPCSGAWLCCFTSSPPPTPPP